MEAIEYQTKINKSDIIPFYGIDQIYLKMPLQDLNKILWEYYPLPQDQYSDGYSMFYNITLTRSIRISIDILKQSVFRIEFFGSYKGSFDGIRIGSSISKLLELRNDIYFDEEYILVGERPYDFIIKIDNNDRTIHSLGEVKENKITSITVENKELIE